MNGTRRKPWFFVALYTVGFAGVACALLSLASVVWFQDWFMGLVSFEWFYGSLAVAVTAFLIGCAGEVWLIVARTPHPKTLRGTLARANNAGAPQIDGVKTRMARAA